MCPLHTCTDQLVTQASSDVIPLRPRFRQRTCACLSACCPAARTPRCSFGYDRATAAGSPPPQGMQPCPPALHQRRLRGNSLLSCSGGTGCSDYPWASALHPLPAYRRVGAFSSCIVDALAGRTDWSAVTARTYSAAMKQNCTGTHLGLRSGDCGDGICRMSPRIVSNKRLANLPAADAVCDTIPERQCEQRAACSTCRQAAQKHKPVGTAEQAVISIGLRQVERSLSACRRDCTAWGMGQVTCVGARLEGERAATAAASAS